MVVQIRQKIDRGAVAVYRFDGTDRERTRVPKRFFEDFTVGQTLPLPERQVGRAEVIAFAAEFDPQPFHLDERAAATDLTSGLFASGWHVCALLMRMLCDAYLVVPSCMGSPGIETLKWRRPVRPGDRLRDVDRDRAPRSAITARDGDRPLPPRGGEPGRRDGGADGEPDLLPARGGIVTYEEFVVGRIHPFGAHHFTGEEIRRFALAYDPQPFHLDEEAARESPFGAICASGWHTASVMMGLLTRYMTRAGEQARSEGRKARAARPVPRFRRSEMAPRGLSRRYDQLHRPHRRKRESASKPAWGLVTVETTGVNQKGETVFVVTGYVFAPKHHAGL